MLQHVAASPGGGDEQFEPLAYLVLPGELAESGWAQGNVKGRVGGFVGFKRLFHPVEERMIT